MAPHARVLALVLLGIVLATGVGAQEPPPPPEEPVEEEQPEDDPPAEILAPEMVVVNPTFTVALTFGSLGLVDLQTQPVLAERLDEDGLVVETADLDRTMGMASGFRVTGSVAAAMGRSWSARLGGTVGRARLTQRYAGEEAWVAEAAALPVDAQDAVSVAGVDLAIRFRIPTDHPFQPYLELGVGAERWHGGSGDPFPGAQVLAAPVTRFGAHAAVGGDYPITSRLAARLHASTRFQRTPLAPLPVGLELARSDSLRITAQAPAAGAFADTAIEHLARTRLEVGLSYAFGGAVVAREDPPESDESPSAPDR